MTLEGGKVDVGDKEHRLRLKVSHSFKDADVTALVQERHLHIGSNCGEIKQTHENPFKLL